MSGTRKCLQRGEAASVLAKCRGAPHYRWPLLLLCKSWRYASATNCFRKEDVRSVRQAVNDGVGGNDDEKQSDRSKNRGGKSEKRPERPNRHQEVIHQAVLSL